MAPSSPIKPRKTVSTSRVTSMDERCWRWPRPASSEIVQVLSGGRLRRSGEVGHDDPVLLPLEDDDALLFWWGVVHLESKEVLSRVEGDSTPSQTFGFELAVDEDASRHR